MLASGDCFIRALCDLTAISVMPQLTRLSVVKQHDFSKVWFNRCLAGFFHDTDWEFVYHVGIAHLLDVSHC